MKRTKIQTILITFIAISALSACGGDKSESLAEKAINKTKDIASSAKDKAGDAVDAAKDAGHSAMEKAGDVKDAAVDAGKDAIDTAKDKAGDAVDAVKETTSDAVDTAKDAGHSAMEKAGDMKDAAVDTGKDAVSAVKEKTGDAIDTAKDAVAMDDKADSPSNPEDAIKAAKESQAAAKKLGFEWRDMGKMIKKAEALAKDGKGDKAMKLANKIAGQLEAIKKQAELAKSAGPRF